MNLTNNPTLEELQKIMSVCDDSVTSHRLVVCSNGDVESIDSLIII